MKRKFQTVFIEIDLIKKKCYGVLNENGKQIHYIGYWGKMVVINWLDDESLKKIKEDRDPYESPICDYFKPHPDKLGKLIWIAGM